MGFENYNKSLVYLLISIRKMQLPQCLPIHALTYAKLQPPKTEKGKLAFGNIIKILEVLQGKFLLCQLSFDRKGRISLNIASIMTLLLSCLVTMMPLSHQLKKQATRTIKYCSQP